MKKIIFALTMIVFVGLSTHAQAAWYDWFWKPKKEASVETKNQNEPKPAAMQAAPEESKSASDTQKNDTEIELLKAEVAALNSNIDSLQKTYSALNTRVAQLEKKSSVPISSPSSNLETKVRNLENKVEDICGAAFGTLSCPSVFSMSSLESRIKKLERGY